MNATEFTKIRERTLEGDVPSLRPTLAQLDREEDRGENRWGGAYGPNRLVPDAAPQLADELEQMVASRSRT